MHTPRRRSTGGRRPPTRLLAVVLALAALALAALALLTVRWSSAWRAVDLGAMLLFGALIVVARRSPLPLAPHTKVLADTAPLFALTLVLPPPLAVVTAALAVLVADTSAGAPWFQVAFHIAEAALRVATGATVYRLLAGDGPFPGLPPVPLLGAAALSGGTMYVLNTALVELMVLLQGRRPDLAALLRRRCEDGPHEAAFLALGLLTAVLATEHLWFTALLAVPAMAVYRAFHASLTLQERLAYQAHHDALTGLANRVSFTERATVALERAGRRAQPVAVLFLDLDGFKQVNDTLGHSTGDALLAALGHRLRDRAAEGAFVARFGGDEFTVLLEGPAATQAERVAESLLAAVAEPVRVGEQELAVSASVGIACAPDGRTTVDELLRDADIAMYHAKAEGRGRWVTFVRGMDAAVRERVALERELREALARDGLTVAYQPIVDLHTGAIMGTEALVRWPHPTRGSVPPARFIPLAEESGLIVPLGRYVLSEACRQTRLWQAHTGQRSLTVSVNLAARQVREPGLVADVAAALAESGLASACLILEITESDLIRDIEGTLRTLRALKGLGVRLALDDFGTGYSSLSYLSRFPFDLIKIDKAFVDRLATPRDAALAQAIVAMAHALHMRVVAEGIERAEQVETLRRLGCAAGQGYYYARPQPAPVVTALLQRGYLPATPTSDGLNHPPPALMPAAHTLPAPDLVP